MPPRLRLQTGGRSADPGCVEWTRRWTRAGWLLAVPVLIGTAGVAGPPAADVVLAAAAVVTLPALVIVRRTVRARREARLRRRRAALWALVRASSDPVLVLDHELRISWAAAALEPSAGSDRLPPAGTPAPGA